MVWVLWIWHWCREPDTDGCKPGMGAAKHSRGALKHSGGATNLLWVLDGCCEAGEGAAGVAQGSPHRARPPRARHRCHEPGTGAVSLALVPQARHRCCSSAWVLQAWNGCRETGMGAMSPASVP